MTDRTNWRSKVFELGVTAAKSIIEDEGEYYACPLCMRGFTQDHLRNGVLTVEDVPPKAQGGKPLLLTCKPCNNTTGHTVDAAVDQREAALRAQQVILGRRSSDEVHATAEVSGLKVNVTVRSTGRSLHIQYRRYANKPEDLNRIQDAMTNLGAETEENRLIHLTARARFKPRYAMVGDLKSAYLMGVAYFGYRFAAQPGLELVRSQIAQPDQDIIKCWWLKQKPFDNEKLWLALIHRPLECLAIGLRRSVVVLPFGEEPARFYDRFNTLSNEKGSDNMTGVFRNWPGKALFLLDFDQDK